MTSSREGSAVHYALATPALAELLASGRAILTAKLHHTDELLSELRASV